MKNFKKNINSHSLKTLIGFYVFNFSIFQFSNFVILPFFILNSSFIIAQNIDQLTYTYKANTNQLKYIDDVTPSSISDVDLDDQSNTNYVYNANGQLIKDEAEGILDIDWTTSGKVKQVNIDDNGDLVADRSLQFLYDEIDNRIKKTETNLSTNSPILTTYYMRNATGELISVYEDAGNGIERKELNIAVGTDNAASESISNGITTRNIGFKNYALKDHLGNVRVVINDVKEPVAGTSKFTSNIKQATDYYSYGMQMPGRSMISAESYRYGFQGKEKDDELKGNGNSYDFGARLLDPRVGRWLSVDPLDVKFPDESPYSAMGNNPVNMIDPDGRAYTSEKHEDENGNITYSQTVTLAVLNRSSFEGKHTFNRETQKDEYSMDGYAQELEQELEAIYTGSEIVDGKTIRWEMDATVRFISDVSELDKENKEHVMILENPSEDEKYGENDNTGGKALSDLDFVLFAGDGFTQNIGTTGSVLEGHELGHTLGLAHNDYGLSNKNPYFFEYPFIWAAQYLDWGSQGDTRNTVMDYNHVEKEQIMTWQVELMYNNFKNGGDYVNGKLSSGYSKFVK